MRLADGPREMDSLLVIRVESMATMSNSEVTGAALSVSTNKKNEGFAVNCLDCVDLTLHMYIYTWWWWWWCRPAKYSLNLSTGITMKS